jgi:hypothetical protein
MRKINLHILFILLIHNVLKSLDVLKSLKALELEKKEKMSDDIALLATFSDGQSLIAGFKLLNDYVSQVNFRFTPEGIFLTREGKAGHNNILFDTKVESKKLLVYKYNAYDGEGELAKEVLVGFDLKTFISRLKTVKRKTAITLTIKAGNSDLYVSTSGESNGSFLLPTSSVDETTFDLEKYYSKEPVCRIIPDECSAAMSRLRDGKCKQIEFRSFSEGILVKGVDSNGKTIVVDSFWQIPEDTGEEKVVKKSKFSIVSKNDDIITFDGGIASTLAKINKMCGRSVISLTMVKESTDHILIVETQFGCFGIFRVVIRSAK